MIAKNLQPKILLPRIFLPRIFPPRIFIRLLPKLSLVAIFAVLMLGACATTESDAPQANAKDVERGWEIIRITNVGSIPAHAASFKVKVAIYLHKPMESFFCQPYSPKRKKAGRKGAEKKFEQIPLGDKVYLGDSERGIGTQSMIMKVNIVSKYTSERRIKWLYYCDGKVDSSA